ncbi:hypothetical protein [Pseudomonas viridiflava]|uniref:hypothetical protein n=1 Tax=Pseudomonas viridiflava TaxID=33069 RepID=UPI000F04D78A|nr:hypothetical protein [Pseudomonas viridiflava]
MNTNGIENGLSCLQQLSLIRSQVASPSGKNAEVEEVIDSAAIEPKAKPFYEYQEEPWLTDPGFEQVSNRYCYVFHKEISVRLELGLAKLDHDRFMKELADTHPKIASKNFGYTLDRDADIKIIDYDSSLTDNDQQVVVDLMSRRDGFKAALQSVARGMMTLVDHDRDREIFGSRYNLDIDDFQFVIDFQKIFNVPLDKVGEEWILQIQRNAERRDSSDISVEA